MPRICRVDSIRKDRSAVRVSWPWGQTRGRYVPCRNKPGYQEYSTETDKMLHEWVPMHFCLNLSDYTPGDYKMFLCDRSLMGKYLEWAPFLLCAEDWQRNRAKGIPAEKDPMAKAKS
jgi:hypothetical protein